MDDTISLAAKCATSSVTQRGVRIHVKKELAREIESQGGIQHFAGNNQNLYRLLQSRVHEEDNPYGNRGDPIRRQLRSLVQYWVQKEKEGKYVSEVLNPWKIVQSKHRMQSSPRVQQQDPDNLSLSSSDDDVSDHSIPATANRNRRTTNFRSPKTNTTLLFVPCLD